MLTDELEGVRPSGSSSVPRSEEYKMPAVIQDEPGRTAAINASQVKQRPPKPVVPPKPPMDTFRYSMANMEDSPDSDLDALLSELCQLETQLASGGPVDNLFKNLGNDFLSNGKQPLPTPPVAKIAPPQRPRNITTVPLSPARPANAFTSVVANQQGLLTVDTSAVQTQRNFQQRNLVQNVTELTEDDNAPAEIDGNGASGELRRRQILPNGHQAAIPESAQHQTHNTTQNGFQNGFPGQSNTIGNTTVASSNRSGSPDNDSAFCDSSSMLSSESALSNGVICGRSSNGSAESSRASLNTPSPTQLSDNVQAHIRSVQEDMKNQNLSEAEQNARMKAEKIKMALEKMKEASIKKLYVKFFTNDGGSKSLLVDERWTVAHILKHLADKNRQALNMDCAIVENYPDLFMERIYEDHELLVENILLWTRDSANKLYFTERKDKYAMFEEPQEFFCAETSAERKKALDPSRKQQLIEEFFAPANVQPPETEGTLYLKADGKKAWKKHYFVLRASGIYYIPKGKSKSSKDLVQLMNLEMNQVYTSIGWKKKYKAPTEFGFALKHPQIQVKASKYIKYLCADDEQTFRKWMVGLRIAKSGRQLFDSCESWKNYLESDEAKSGTFSLRNSISTENCSGETSSQSSEPGVFRDSVVMRPRSSASQGDATEVKVRPRSADISRGGNKRNSRTLMQVELPTIPSEPENFYSDDLPDGGLSQESPCPQMQLNGVNGVNGVMNAAQAQLYSSTYSNGSDRNRRGSGSQTPTPTLSENSQPNAFFQDSDSTTGTIKRQPTPQQQMTHAGRQLQPPGASMNARLPLTEQTARLGGAGRRISGHSSGDSGSMNSGFFGQPEDEEDSDEELPPPPPEIQAEVELSPQRGSLYQTPILPEEYNHYTTAALVHQQPQVSPGLPLPSSPLMNGSQVSPGAPKTPSGVVKRPPPPPKRSEGTRLSTTALPVAPKPAVPAKPSRAEYPVGPPGAPARPQAPVVGGADFNSELQRAMAKRLQKLEVSEQENCGESNGLVHNGSLETGNCIGFVTNFSPNRTPRAGKAPPPPPPKRQC